MLLRVTTTLHGCRLLAVDLDGTLVCQDGSIAPDDLAAIELSRASGVRVVIATGRFPGSCAEVARQICCEEIVICADGAIVLHGEETSAFGAIEPQVAQRVRDFALAQGFGFFAFGKHTIHFAAQHTSHLAFVEGWSRGARLCPDSEDEAPLVQLMAVGHVLAVGRSVEPLRSAFPEYEVDAFPLTEERWALRVRHPEVEKGRALSRLARSLGVPRDEIVAVGNDYNDLSLFRAAGRSFSMGDAPLAVRHAATHVLRATSAVGGGVAEAMLRIQRA